MLSQHIEACSTVLPKTTRWCGGLTRYCVEINQHMLCLTVPTHHSAQRVQYVMSSLESLDLYEKLPNDAFWIDITVFDPYQPGVVSTYKMTFNIFYFNDWYYNHLALFLHLVLKVLRIMYILKFTTECIMRFIFRVILSWLFSRVRTMSENNRK